MTDPSLCKTVLCALLVATAGAPLLRGSGRPKGAGAAPAEGKAGAAPAESKASADETVRTMLDLLEGLKGLKPTRAYLDWGLTGGLLEGHLVRGHRIAPGADLRGANLRWADLRRCNLEAADLRDADLTGARLGSALLRGAKLQGAQLYLAETGGAIGLDLDGARLHPFFDPDPEEPVGAVKILRLSEHGREDKAQPGNLVCGASGRLFWTLGDHPDIQGMTPTGEILKVSPSGDTRMRAMVKDSRDRMWGFGDRRLCLFDLGVAAGAGNGTLFETDCAEWPLAAIPSQVTAGAHGDVWLSLPGRAVRLNFDPVAGKFDMSELPFKQIDPSLPANSRVVSSRDGLTIFFASPDSPRALAWAKGTRRTAWLDLAQYTVGDRVICSRPQRIVMGPDDRVWLTQTGAHGVTEIYPDPASQAIATELHPVLTGKTPPGPHGIAIGPDGCMWFTLTTGNQIARIGPEGRDFQQFDLPPGTRPVELVCGHDGRLFFTLEGRNAIGSIRARKASREGEFSAQELQDLEAIAAYAAGVRAEPAAPAAEAKVEAKVEPGAGAGDWAGPVYRPRPARVKPATQAQRWATHLELERVAEERRQARLAEEREPAGAGAADPGAEAGDARAEAEDTARVEAKAESAAAPADRPTGVMRLWEENVYLTRGAVRHAQRRHGRHARKPAGQFAEAYWNREALERLIADGLLESGAIGKVRARSNPELDRGASFFTRCRQKDVVGAYYTRAGAKVATRTFEVCTLRAWHDGIEIQVVKTAYPVPD